MSFPRYPAYKLSGVEWLGEVPDHWSLKPVFGVASQRDEDNKGMGDQTDHGEWVEAQPNEPSPPRQLAAPRYHGLLAVAEDRLPVE
jgi:hypothetical protein